MNNSFVSLLEQCERHAARLQWAMTSLSKHFPLTVERLGALNDMDIAVLDQFSTRFAKLRDSMGAKLFPALLELTKEQGDLGAFLDKLYRLEKIGAIPSSEEWLLLREVRDEFAHDYPEDPAIQAAMLNRAYGLAGSLLSTLDHVERFAARYLAVRKDA